MQIHNIPRNTKGETRIFFIFSKKAMIYTVIGAIVGFPIYMLLKLCGVNQYMSLIAILVFAFIGFSIGTFRFPEIGTLRSSTSIGGEAIDDVIRRFIQFKMKGKKIFINYSNESTKEESVNGK